MTATARPPAHPETTPVPLPGKEPLDIPSAVGEPSPFCARIARLATVALDVPVAFVSGLEANGWLVRGAVDHDGHDIARQLPLGRRADGTREPYASIPGILSYLEHPLHTADAVVTGALCVADRRPRRWSDADKRLLAEIAGLLVHRRSIDEPGGGGPEAPAVTRRLTGEITALSDAVLSLAELAEQHEDPRLHRLAAASRKRLDSVTASAGTLTEQYASTPVVQRFEMRQAVNRAVREAVFISGRGRIAADLGSVPLPVSGDRFAAEGAIAQLITVVLHHSSDGRVRVTLRPGRPEGGTGDAATLSVTAVGSALPVAAVARILARFQSLHGSTEADRRSDLRFVDGKIVASAAGTEVRSNRAGTLVVTRWPSDRA
ncbi:GAF domain-containing protein [Nocardia sp. NPDC058499]|uniref:GAF domain-containing protein n=1 Tax=Nocardia sp. NPDC058499 TaxID=3346530 RepID=UPI0036503669